MGTWSSKSRERATYGLGALLIVAAFVISASNQATGGNEAYEWGRAFGTGAGRVVVAIVFATLGRAFVNRLRGRADAGWIQITSSSVLAAGAIALVWSAVAGQPQSQAEESVDQFNDNAQECRASEPSPAERLPAGLGATRLSLAQVAELSGQTVPSGIDPDLVESYLVGSGPDRALVSIAAIGDEQGRIDFEAGVTASFTANGAVVDSTTIAGVQVQRMTVASPPVIGILASSGCYGITITSPTERTATAILGPLAAG